MLRRQTVELARLMADWVRLAFALGIRQVRLGGVVVRGVLGRGAAKRSRVAAHGRQVAARTRFWTELRTGQREAQARSATPDR